MDLTPVSRLMTRNVVTVEREQSLLLAQDLVRAKRVLHLPIVDEQEHLVGMVSQMQLLAAHARLAEAMGSAQDEAELTIPVSHVMETDVKSVGPDTPAADALELMLREKVWALPVVEDRKVVGILTRRDFLSFELGALRAVVERSCPEARARRPQVPAPRRTRPRQAAATPAMPKPHVPAGPTTDAAPTLVRNPAKRALVRPGFWGAAAAAVLLAGLSVVGLEREAPPTSPTPLPTVEPAAGSRVVVVALEEKSPPGAEAKPAAPTATEPGAPAEPPPPSGASAARSATQERAAGATERRAVAAAPEPPPAAPERPSSPGMRTPVEDAPAPPAQAVQPLAASQPLAYAPEHAGASTATQGSAKPVKAPAATKGSSRPTPAKRTWVPEPLPYDLVPPR